MDYRTAYIEDLGMLRLALDPEAREREMMRIENALVQGERRWRGLLDVLAPPSEAPPSQVVPNPRMGCARLGGPAPAYGCACWVCRRARREGRG